MNRPRFVREEIGRVNEATFVSHSAAVGLNMIRRGILVALAGCAFFDGNVTCAIEFVDDFSKNYAVYFDPEEEPDRNPKGFGWNPVPPAEWGSVDKVCILHFARD